jgi:hypothetical protein
MVRICLAGLLALAAAAPAQASWADGLFEEHHWDFGSVTRGPALTHYFRVVNTTGQPVHLSGCRVSCGCTSAWPLQYDLAPGQETAVVAQMDTHRFVGHKTVTIFVNFDQPQYDEVHLTVTANGRDDLMLMPDTLVLGRVRRGTAPTTGTTITFLSDPNWQITSVATDTNYIQPVCKMTRREGFEVAYNLTVRLRPDTPAGKWYSDLWLTTNSPSSPRIRVPLTVEIEPAVTISPARVNLGEIKKGTDGQQKVIVRGVQPFRITRIKGVDDRIAVKDSSTEAKTVHVLTLTVHASNPGDLNRRFRVITDVKGEDDLEFTAHGRIVP